MNIKRIKPMEYNTMFEFIEKEHTSPYVIKLNASPYAIPFYEALGFRKTGDQAEYHGMIYTPMALEGEING